MATFFTKVCSLIDKDFLYERWKSSSSISAKSLFHVNVLWSALKDGLQKSLLRFYRGIVEFNSDGVSYGLIWTNAHFTDMVHSVQIYLYLHVILCINSFL